MVVITHKQEFDEEELDPHGECAVEIKRLRAALEKTEKRMRRIGFLDEAERIELLLRQ